VLVVNAVTVVADVDVVEVERLVVELVLLDVVVVVIGVVVIDVVVLAQDAKTSDITVRNVSPIQIALLFMSTSFFISIFIAFDIRCIIVFHIQYTKLEASVTRILHFVNRNF